MKNFIKNLQKEEHYQSDFSKWSKNTKKDDKVVQNSFGFF